jgi:hypothetical protein
VNYKIHLDTVIVEAEGKRFPVKKSKLTNEKVSVVKPITPPVKEPKRKKAANTKLF